MVGPREVPINVHQKVDNFTSYSPLKCVFSSNCLHGVHCTPVLLPVVVSFINQSTSNILVYKNGDSKKKPCVKSAF